MRAGDQHGADMLGTEPRHAVGDQYGGSAMAQHKMLWAPPVNTGEKQAERNQDVGPNRREIVPGAR